MLSRLKGPVGDTFSCLVAPISESRPSGETDLCLCEQAVTNGTTALCLCVLEISLRTLHPVTAPWTLDSGGRGQLARDHPAGGLRSSKASHPVPGAQRLRLQSRM